MQTLSPITVIRVISDNHKDEVACVTLAAGTLHEEKSFFTIFNTQDKNFRRDVFERDLQTIYSLLHNRVWFAFDVELAAKAIQRLYENTHQSTPQSLGHWEAMQLFESTFSQPCNSLDSAAQHLHILPWHKRSINARTECDVTCEVLSRIALNHTVRQLATPNQNVASSASDNQMHDSQKMMPNRTQDAETQSHPYSHPPADEKISYDTTNLEETQFPASMDGEERGRTEMVADKDLSHNEHYNTSINKNNETNINDTNMNQPISQENDINAMKELETENKTPEEFGDNRGRADVSHSMGTQLTSPHQNQKSNAEHFHRGIETKRESNVEKDTYTDENINSRRSEMPTMGTDESSGTGRGGQGRHAGGGPTSWKDLARGKGAVVSPPRTSQLHIIPGARKKTGQTWFKQLQPIRDQQQIKQYVTNAMTSNRTIWISYDGGRQPLVPRGVKPTRWDDHPGTEVAFLGIPHRSKTQKESKFFLRDVKEVLRDKQWSRPEDAKFGYNKNKTNTGKQERTGKWGNEERSNELQGNIKADDIDDTAENNEQNKLPKRPKKKKKLPAKAVNT